MGQNVTLLTSCFFLFNECNCQGPAERRTGGWRGISIIFLSYSNGKQKEKKKNTISKQLAMPDRSSVVPKEQTKLVLIKQTPRARGSHQKEGGGAVMATKLFFSYLYIQRGIWGRRRRKDSIEEGKEKERRLISHCLSPFCLCLRPRQRQIMLTLWVCILEHSSVMNAGQLTDITA